jgi:hypothetical protein
MCENDCDEIFFFGKIIIKVKDKKTHSSSRFEVWVPNFLMKWHIFVQLVLCKYMLCLGFDINSTK